MVLFYTVFIFSINLRMDELILREIEKRHNESGGHCGLMAVELCRNIGKDYSEVKGTLNRLNSEGKFKVRKGIHGYLLFKN